MRENELIGRFEALVAYVLHLTEELEMAGVIDGINFSRRVRGPVHMDDQLEYMQIARDRLGEMMDVLDRARADRGDPGPTRSGDPAGRI